MNAKSTAIKTLGLTDTHSHNLECIKQYLGVNLIGASCVGSRSFGTQLPASDYDYCFVFDHNVKTFVPAKRNVHFNIQTSVCKIDVNAFTKEGFAWDIFKLQHHAVLGLFGGTKYNSKFFEELREVVIEFRCCELIRSLLFQAKSYLSDKREQRTRTVAKSYHMGVVLVCMAIGVIQNNILNSNRSFKEMSLYEYGKMLKTSSVLDTVKVHILEHIENWVHGNRTLLSPKAVELLTEEINKIIATFPDTQKGTRRPSGCDLLFEAHNTDYVKAINTVINKY